MLATRRRGCTASGEPSGIHTCAYLRAARGARTQESDFDILVLTDNSLSTKEENDIIDAVYDLELDCGIVISLIFYTKEHWQSSGFSLHPFHLNVEKDAIFA